MRTIGKIAVLASALVAGGCSANLANIQGRLKQDVRRDDLIAVSTQKDDCNVLTVTDAQGDVMARLGPGKSYEINRKYTNPRSAADENHLSMILGNARVFASRQKTGDACDTFNVEIDRSVVGGAEIAQTLKNGTIVSKAPAKPIF